jgi:hypothetical protein
VPLAPPLPRGGEAHEVRRRRAGRERPTPLGRELEELLQPLDGHRLEPRGERGADPAERVLVERGREPIGAQRRGRHSARDEVEEPRAGRRSRSVEPAEQLLERGDGAGAVLGERAVEAGGRLLRPLGQDEPLVELGEPGRRMVEGEAGGRLGLVAHFVP